MNANLGLVLAVIGGALMGSFSLPMKKTSRWAWETTWLVWAVTALVAVPWMLVNITLPRVLPVYAQAGSRCLAMVFLFGAGWGVGAVLFGQAISLLGMSLAFAISIGLTLALGALVPMAATPAVFLTPGGITVTLGIAVMLLGVTVCAVAGRRKELQIQNTPASTDHAPVGPSTGAFLTGLIVCILSGIFNPMLNFAFTFSDRIKQAAAAAGASESGASDAVWAIALLGGFVMNFIYCAVLLTRNRTWSDYRRAGTASHWPLAVAMGVTWVMSIIIYGRAASMMGTLGGSAGWAITMGCSITASNIWGIVTGEWEQGRGIPLRTMYVGLACILLAIAVIGYGNALNT